MPVTSVSSDPEKLTLTIVGEYPVSVERLWTAYADPRQLERFFGPPEWPATFTRHDFKVGGESRWHMTGPNGERPGGWWRFVAMAMGAARCGAQRLCRAGGTRRNSITP